MSEAPTWQTGISEKGHIMKKYDTVVIGGGPAGYKSALKLAEKGQKVCIIEKSIGNIGGTCLNEGCIPVKSILKSAEIYKAVSESAQYGILCENPGFDMEAVREKMQTNVELLKNGLISAIKKAKVDIIEATASFIDRHSVNAGGETVNADFFLIASGSVTAELPDIKADGRKILTSRELLKNTLLPEKLLVIGGGVIGCEFASFYSRLGSSVTIVEPMDELLPNEDSEAGKALQREFKKSKIKCDTSSIVKSLKYSGEKLTAVISGKKEREEEFDLALLSVGRRANLDGLKLENAGVEIEKSHIKVNSYMQTTAENIYCAGDAADGFMLAHTAYDEAMCAAINITEGNSRVPERTAVPRVVFCSPEIGAVGLTEKQAEEKYSIEIHKEIFKTSGKALIEGAGEGFVKIISDAETEIILGAVIVGKSATELIHEFIPAVKNKLTVSDIRSCVHAHPTLSETAWEALLH